jgi:type II secretory pathway predicted ATPase ExeA
MTYERFFQLKDRPFRLSPDTEYFFPSAVHKDIMQHLLYSINTEEGFVEITGEPGIGKTITLRSLVEQINEEVLISMIVNPTISSEELLKAVALDFGLRPQDIENQSGEHILRLIQVRLIDLVEQGTIAVIVIDEAQNLSDRALEQICLISNIEIHKKKAVKIILVGQLELENNLQRPELKKIFQRITVRCRLTPLSKKDTILYINHRIRVAGGLEFRQPQFSKKVINMIYEHSNGLPRLINLICERSLMAAFAEKKTSLTKSHVKKAIKSFQPKESVAKAYKRKIRVQLTLTGIIIAICLGGAIYLFQNLLKSDNEPLKQTIMPSQSLKHQKDPKKNQKHAKSFSQADQHIKKTLQDVSVRSSKSETATQSQGLSKNNFKSNSAKMASIKKEAPPKVSPDKVFPGQLMTISPGQRIIIFFPDINKMVIWKQTDKKPEHIKTINMYTNLREGIYLLGRDKKLQPFLLNPFIAQNSIPKSLPETFLHNVGDILSDQLIPVLVYLSGKTFDHPIYDNAKTCCSLVEQWALAWRSKRIDDYLNFYDTDGIQFYKINHQARHMEWEKMKTTKALTFARTTEMTLDILYLNGIIDPANPKAAIVMFHQRYKARNYSDEGIKVLFLSQKYPKHDRSTIPLEKQAVWRITGRFWIEIKP